MDRMLEAMVAGWQALRVMAGSLGPRRTRTSDDAADVELEWIYRSEAFAEDLF